MNNKPLQIIDNSQQGQQFVVPAPKLIDSLTPSQRQQIADFGLVLGFMFSLREDVSSCSKKIKAFQDKFVSNELPDNVKNSLDNLRGVKKHKPPHAATFHRWIEKLTSHQQGNQQALVKQYKGRQREVYGWEQQAIELFNLPSKPGYADVAFWLRTDHGYASATKSRVTSFLKTLPETLGKQSPGRMGKHFYHQNLKPHKIRDNDKLPIGYGYEGDGHTVDAYVAHPATGKLYRPEITVWIDVKSRFVVGWYLSNAESAVSTLFALSAALLNHDHVPCELFVDNGSGFKARLMTDEIAGFFTRMGMRGTFSLPGNSRGKGLVEGFFKIYRNRLDKKYQTYCGHDMAPEINRRLPEMVKRGKRTLPSFEQYKQDVAQFIEAYNDEPKGVLDGKCPRDIWQGLKRVPVITTADALVQPRVIRTVTKTRVTLHNRIYQAAELAQYNGREMIVQYDLHRDDEVLILNQDQQWVCLAKLVSKIDRAPDSRIVEQQQKSLKASIVRHELHIAEKIARSQPVITHEDSIEALNETLAFDQPPAIEQDFDPLDCLYLGDEQKDEGDDDLDINDTFNL